MSTDPQQTAAAIPAPAPAPETTPGAAEPAVDRSPSESVAAAGSADVPQESAAASPPADATPAPSAEAETEAAAGDAAKRKLRLNPTMIPQALRPIPQLSSSESLAPPELTQPPATASAAETASMEIPAVQVAPPEPALPPTPRQAVDIPRGEELDADMEAAIAAAVQGGELEAAPVAPPAEEGAAPVTEETLEPGAKLKGTIQSVSVDSVFIDFGLRMTGIIPLRQFDPKKPPQVGASVTATVDKVDETEGLIQCNLPRGRGKVSHDWSAVVVGQTVECNVSGANKGGLEVNVGSLRGFLPASQVDLGYVPQLEAFVGQRLSVRVTEVNPARRRLIVSRRALLAEERQASESTMLEQLHPGQVHSGVVKSLKDFGAFVDLGGIDGFLHVGQISWQRINKPSDVLTEGQPVEVKILTVDREKKRISLSLRQMEQNPWGAADVKYAKGTTVTGRVTRIEPFGAFIELEPGIEGLVHISELDHKRVRSVGDVLSANQMVDFQVLEVDPKKRRISLSAKALKSKPEEAPREVPDAASESQRSRKPNANLKGGIGGAQKGGLFGDPRQFS